MAKREEMRNLETIPVGSLGIIALKGYGQASTGDSVPEAGISRGLLVPYMFSKIGL